MKSCYSSLLILLILSCGSNQSTSDNRQRNNSNDINNKKDCSAQVTAYAENSYRLHGQINGGLTKIGDGSYKVTLSKPNPMSSNTPLYSYFQIWVDDNCKVINSKQLNTRFKM